MSFKLKPNTATGGYCLHTDNDYAYCPHSSNNLACGTWCALFHLSPEKTSLRQACSPDSVTIYFKKEENEKTTEGSK